MKSLGDKILEVLFESAEIAAEALTASHVERHNGSPIEKLMLHALWSRGCWRGKVLFDEGACHSDETLRHAVRSAVNFDACQMFTSILTQQMAVGNFRADFGLAAATSDERSLVVAIECDGHEFHEKSRKQVARDKARDRAFTERDIRVFRFSGSEIWNDAGSCADQVLSFVSQWQDQPLTHFAKNLDSRRVVRDPTGEATA